MKQDVDILIFLEHLNRELDTALLLKILLSQRGYSVRLASVFYDLWESVATLRPRLLIVPWAYSEVRKYCRFEPQPGEGLRILNLHHEQIGLEGDRANRMVPLGDAEKVFHLAWGERFEQVLRSRGIPEALIFRTGSPRLDFLRKEMKNFNPTRNDLAERYSLDPGKRWLLIAGNFSIVSVSERTIRDKVNKGFKDYPEFVEKARQLYEKVIHWMVRLASENKDIEVIYRPHPAERLTRSLCERVQNTPGFSLIWERPVGDWIVNAGSVFVWSSTSSVDALACDKPVFSLRLDKGAKSALPGGYLPIIDDLPIVASYEEFVQAAYSNEKPSRHRTWEAALSRYREFYDTPDEPAFQKLERKIAEIMDSGIGNRFDRMPVPAALEIFYRLQQAGKRKLHDTGLIRHFRRYEKEAGERLLPDLIAVREGFLREKLSEKPWSKGKGE